MDVDPFVTDFSFIGSSFAGSSFGDTSFGGSSLGESCFGKSSAFAGELSISDVERWRGKYCSPRKFVKGLISRFYFFKSRFESRPLLHPSRNSRRLRQHHNNPRSHGPNFAPIPPPLISKYRYNQKLGNWKDWRLFPRWDGNPRPPADRLDLGWLCRSYKIRISSLVHVDVWSGMDAIIHCF
jgi:hypothetical protein